MGIWSNLKEIGRLSTISGSKEYRKKLLLGQDVITGKPCLQTDTKKRLENLERIEAPRVENGQSILMQIRELEEKLHGTISEEEKVIVKSYLELLYKKYDGIHYKEEKSKEGSMDGDELEL